MFIGPLPNSFPGCDVGELLPRDVHRQERIQVDIRIDADGVSFLLGELDCFHDYGPVLAYGELNA